jgi:hypothetical protein
MIFSVCRFCSCKQFYNVEGQAQLEFYKLKKNHWKTYFQLVMFYVFKNHSCKVVIVVSELFKVIAVDP